MNDSRDDTFFDALDRLLERQAKVDGDFQTAVSAMCVLYGFVRSHATDEKTALSILEAALAFAARKWRQGVAVVTCEYAIENAKKENKNGQSVQPDEST